MTHKMSPFWFKTTLMLFFKWASSFPQEFDLSKAVDCIRLLYGFDGIKFTGNGLGTARRHKGPAHRPSEKRKSCRGVAMD